MGLEIEDLGQSNGQGRGDDTSLIQRANPFDAVQIVFQKVARPRLDHDDVTHLGVRNEHRDIDRPRYRMTTA